MQFVNYLAVVTSVTHVVQVRQQAPATSECPSILSSLESAMPTMPSKLASAQSIVKTDVCHYIRPPIQTSLVEELYSMYDQWSSEADRWAMTSSNAAVIRTVKSRCQDYLLSSATSSLNSLTACGLDFSILPSTESSTGLVSTTMESSAAEKTTAAETGKTTTAETGSSVTPAGAATPTPTTPGAGARSGVSIVLVAGAIFVGSFLVL